MARAKTNPSNGSRAHRWLALRFPATVTVACEEVPTEIGLQDDAILRLSVLRTAACTAPVAIIARYDPAALTKPEAALVGRLLRVPRDIEDGVEGVVNYAGLQELLTLKKVTLYPAIEGFKGQPKQVVPDTVLTDGTDTVHVVFDLGGEPNAAAAAVRTALGELVQAQELLTATRQLLLSLKASAMTVLAALPVVCAVHVDETFRPAITSLER